MVEHLSNNALMDKAEHLVASGAIDEANALVSLLLTRPLSLYLLCRLGSVAADLQRREDAEHTFLRAIRRAPERPEPYVDLGLLYLQHHALDEAVRCFTQALGLEERPHIYSLLGMAQSRLYLTEAARTSYAHALRLDPQYEEVYFNLGLTWQEEDPAHAMTLFHKALEVDPTFACAHRELGWGYLKLRELSAAEQHLRQALALDARDGWTYIYLGNTLWRAGNLVAAQDAYEKAIQLWPDRSIGYWTLADLFWHQERLQDAHRLYARAVEVEPDDVEAHYRFGRFLQACGDTEQARDHLTQALRLDPAHTKAKAALEGEC